MDKTRRSAYDRRRYRLKKYGDPDYVIPRKVPISSGALPKRDYMKAYKRIQKHGNPDVEIKPGRPRKYGPDESRYDIDLLKKRLYTHGKKTYKAFDFSPEEKDRLIRNDIEEYMKIFLDVGKP